MRWHKVNDNTERGSYPEQGKVIVVMDKNGVWDKAKWEGWNLYEWRRISDYEELYDITHWAEVEPPTEGNTITE